MDRLFTVLLGVLFVAGGLIGQSWHWKGESRERPMNWVVTTLFVGIGAGLIGWSYYWPYPE